MAYSIKGNKLTSDEGNVEYYNTTKKSGVIDPKFLVIHYTAGASYEADVKTLSTSTTQASCQLVLSKDGKWANIGKLNDALWHAGKSEWKGYSMLNRYSIGIEVCCEGIVDYVRTEADGSKVYRTWFGKELNNKTTPIVDGAHPNGGPVKGWVLFTQKQVEELIEVSQLLIKHYKLQEAVGHDQIAPGRKSDPGLSMPSNVYSILNGRTDDEQVNVSTKILTVTGAGNLGLNLRAWPATTSQILTVMPNSTQVKYIRSNGDWQFVEVDGLQGWAHKDYLK